MPLTVYTQMVNQLSQVPRPAPAAFAIGQSSVVIQVTENEDRIAATVNVTVLIETFEQWFHIVFLAAFGAGFRRSRRR